MAILLHKGFSLTVSATHEDHLGCFVRLEGCYEAKQYSFVSVYVPQHCLQGTLHTLHALLLNLPMGATIIGGDFNAVRNPSIDVSGPITAGRNTCASQLSTWVDSMGLCDAWRVWNPLTRAYTHTSAAHRTQSRINQIWLAATDMPILHRMHMLPRGISDHAPLMAELGQAQGVCPSWRFNAWYLQNPECAT